MAEIWVKEFTGGLDTRRMPETSPGGTLIQASDGHITSGGEFEKRAAFVPTYELLPGTVGMAYTRTGIVVFGSDAAPVGLPTGVTYQRLQHPNGTSRLLSVPSFDLYKGLIYAVGIFSDGSRQHYYDGVHVDDWFDGRARAMFQVTAGGPQAAVAATGSFTITGGSAGAGNEISSVTIDGVTVTSGAVAHTGGNAATATAVAADINSATSTPDYTAAAVGNIVYITAATAGAASNGFAVVATVGGDATVADATALAGGADAGTSTLISLTVDGIDILFSSVEWAGSNAATAAAIADAINSAATSPEYDAISNGDQVVILADVAGAAANGRSVVIGTSLGFGVTPGSGIAMAGGVDLEGTFEPGTFVRTIKSKMYSVSGPDMHFSGIQQPTKWTTDSVGAGFVDMSSESSGSEELVALARYQDSVAVFAATLIQIWYVDPDPTLNKQSQSLNNTGTAFPRSVTQFGDNDLFYLDESGLRSLRARDSSNAASTTDIGVPVDGLVKAAVKDLSVDDRQNVIGLIEPRDGRFWLIIGGEIFVFSFFSGAKVSAWSKYNTVDASGDAFTPTDAVVFNRHVWLRAADTIYCYGGAGNDPVYDSTEAVAQIPYLDGDAPWQPKHFEGVDLAAQGAWKIYAATNPNNIEAQDKIGVFANVVSDTTYGDARIPGAGQSTHFSLIFKSQGDGYAKLGACVIHFTTDEDPQN